MNKLDSLRLLDKWGYNVVLFYVDPQEQTIEEVIKYFGETHRFGVRTCLRQASKGNFNHPFLIDAPLDKAMDFAKKQAKKYYVILSGIVPPELVVISGHIQLNTNFSGCYEIFRGPGIVRDIMNMSKNRIETIDFEKIYEIKDPIIRPLVIQLRHIAIRSGFDKTIIEFNLNSNPVGKKSEKLVVWEFRETK